MFFLGEVEHIIGDGILTGDDRTGEDEVFCLANITVAEERGEEENKDSVFMYLSGILTGVEGRRGLVSPLLGLSGRDRLGPPSEMDAGLGYGVPGVNVSELCTDRSPVLEESIDSVGLADNPVSAAGIKYIP